MIWPTEEAYCRCQGGGLPLPPGLSRSEKWRESPAAHRTVMTAWTQHLRGQYIYIYVIEGSDWVSPWWLNHAVMDRQRPGRPLKNPPWAALTAEKGRPGKKTTHFFFFHSYILYYSKEKKRRHFSVFKSLFFHRLVTWLAVTETDLEKDKHFFTHIYIYIYCISQKKRREGRLGKRGQHFFHFYILYYSKEKKGYV